MKRSIVAIALLPLLFAVPVRAGEVDITPEIGYYAPLSDQVDIDNGTLTAKHATAIGFGGRLTFWANPNFAIELNGMYTATEMEAHAFGQTGSIDANVFFGTARAVLGFGKSARFLLSGGLGVQSSSYDYIEGGTWMIGVIGAGLMIPLGESAALRVGVDDYMYNAQWDLGGGIMTDTIFQNDVTYTAGISFRTGRK